MLDKKTKDLQYPLRNVVLCQEHKIFTSICTGRLDLGLFHPWPPFSLP